MDTDIQVEDGGIIEFAEDLADAKEPPLLPPGDYSGTIREVELKASQNTGNKFYEIAFEIGVDQFPPDFEAEFFPEGKKLIHRVMVPTNANQKFRLKQFVRSINGPMGTRIDPNDWLGSQAMLGVIHSTFNENTREEIKTLKSVV